MHVLDTLWIYFLFFINQWMNKLDNRVYLESGAKSDNLVSSLFTYENYCLSSSLIHQSRENISGLVSTFSSYENCLVYLKKTCISHVNVSWGGFLLLISCQNPFLPIMVLYSFAILLVTFCTSNLHTARQSLVFDLVHFICQCQICFFIGGWAVLD